MWIFTNEPVLEGREVKIQYGIVNQFMRDVYMYPASGRTRDLNGFLYENGIYKSLDQSGWSEGHPNELIPICIGSNMRTLPSVMPNLVELHTLLTNSEI